MILNNDQALLDIDGQEAGLIDLAAYQQALHKKWQPHPGQIPIGQALFHYRYKDIFACCGRNFGKTEVIAYCTDRYANENPHSENYIFGPVQKQVKEILWASGRIQGLGPEEYKTAINNVEMRITYSNKSFLKLDGSNNVDDYRGIKPKGISVYDELKDMKPEFIDAYDPNRAAFDSPAIYIGTPPEFHNHFVELMEKAKKYHGDTWFYLHAPSWINPHLSKRFLDNKKRELIESGDIETWQREYEAIYVKGGKRHIFPQFLKLEFKPYQMPIDLNKWQLFISFDPAASSVFAVLFALFNPYTKKIIIFDEIYESNPSEMTARKMYQKVEEKLFFYRGKLDGTSKKVKEFRWIYDEAARYFRSEIYEIPNNDWQLEQSRKSDIGINGYISIVRSVLNKELITVTENCTKFRWEMDNYIKDENGKIPSNNDHLINSLQYMLQAMGFNLDESPEPKEEDPFLIARAISIEQDLAHGNKLVDFDETFQNHSFQELD